MGLSTTGPITPYVGSWAWSLEQKRKLADLRERAATLFINNRRAEAAECEQEAADLERRLKREA